MKRTTTRRRREMTAFFEANRRLFPFVGLFLLGAGLGVLVYMTVAVHLPEGQSSLFRVEAVTGGFRAGLSALWGACFSVILWLLALFLLGLWSCGAPFVLAVPLLHGLGLGLTESYYYALGRPGVLAVVTVVLPHGLLCAGILAMAGAESLRLSLRLSRQLLPTDKAEPMWPQFRLYCMRFLLFLVVAVAAGILHVLLRTLFAGLLP